MPYLINLDNRNVSSDVGSPSSLPSQVRVTIVTSRNLGINEDDKIIFIKKNREGGYSFTFYGKVYSKESETVEPILKLGESPLRINHTLGVDLEGKIEHDLTVANLAYSLIKVYRHASPSVHFGRPYSYIQERDYQTIRASAVFVARTVFGKLANALPAEHKLRFITYAISTVGNSYFKGYNYPGAFELLRKYIDDNIVGPGRYLVSANERMTQVIPEDHIRKIGFKRDNESAIGVVTLQARKISRLLNSAKERDIWTESQRLIRESDESDRLLERYFLDKPWPIRI